MSFKPYKIIIREWDFSQGIPVLVNQDRNEFTSKDVTEAFIKTLLFKYEHNGFSCRRHRLEENKISFVCTSTTRTVIIYVEGL